MGTASFRTSACSGSMGILVAGIAQPPRPAVPGRFYERLLESRDGLWNTDLGSIVILVALAHRQPGSRYDWLHNFGLGAVLVDSPRTCALHPGHTGRVGVHLVAGLLEPVDWISKVIKFREILKDIPYYEPI